MFFTPNLSQFAHKTKEELLMIPRKIAALFVAWSFSLVRNVRNPTEVPTPESKPLIPSQPRSHGMAGKSSPKNLKSQ